MRKRVARLTMTVMLASAVMGLTSCQSPFRAAGRADSGGEPAIRTVRTVLVREESSERTVEAFGALFYKARIDLVSTQEGLVVYGPPPEGTDLRAGDTVVRLENGTVRLAVARSVGTVAQAEAGLGLAGVQLAEARLAAEARLLSLEKAGMELGDMESELAEMERRQADQELLHGQGGVASETVRSGRFAVEAQRSKVAATKLGIASLELGLRDEDLAAAGLAIPSSATERKAALLELAVASSARQVEVAKALLETARRDQEAARLAEAGLLVLAPRAGRIVSRMTETGGRVHPGEVVASLVDLSTLYAHVTVPEADAVSLEAGMKATVTVDASGRSFQASVETVAPLVDPASATCLIRLALDQGGDAGLRPGMFVSVAIRTGLRTGRIVVPPTVLTGSGGRTAFVVTEGKVRAMTVERGEELADGVEVLGGLAAGDVVVDAPDAVLKEGDRVEPER